MTYNTWRVNRDRINVLQYAFACQPMIIFTTELLCCQHPFPHYPQFTMPEGRVEASPCPMFRHGLQLARAQRVGDGPGLPGVRQLRQGRGQRRGWGARIAQLLQWIMCRYRVCCVQAPRRTPGAPWPTRCSGCGHSGAGTTAPARTTPPPSTSGELGLVTSGHVTSVLSPDWSILISGDGIHYVDATVKLDTRDSYLTIR